MPLPHPKKPRLPLPNHLILLISLTLISILTFSFTHLHPTTSHPYLSHLSSPHIHRLGCREYDAGAQSCVFSGLACINTTASFSRPIVYLLEHHAPNHERVPSDDWCLLRHQSADPRYFSSRHWPIKPTTIVPQRSCLDARYRTADSLNLTHAKVRWVPNLWLVDLDNVRNNHNNHLLKDILWLLDVHLWERSIDSRPTPQQPLPPRLFDPTHRLIYLPQGRSDFVYQTSRDINRLIYALVLQLDPSLLYPNQTLESLHSPPLTPRTATPLLSAYPNLSSSLLFHRDILSDNATDLVCTARLTVGAKIGNGAHERVCRHLRTQAYRTFGITRPVMRRLGRIYYPQPPKRVLILQRHLTRRLANLEELETALRAALEPHAVAIEVLDTRALATAEAHVRIFSRAGVVVTPHGSQAMGQLFMPRHSALVEIMPLGYTDYAFNLLADSCRIWYYELQGVLGKRSSQDFVKHCANKVPHMMNPCTNVKFKDVWADVDKVVDTVRFAMQRMGHTVGEWLPDDHHP